ncbi:hypothetical protein MASR2M29_02210 [Spirochaetota bacterium]
MNVEEFKKTATNPKKWFEYAIMQKRLGDAIVDSILKALPNEKDKSKMVNDIIYFWSNAHFHYGIGIENGLKGIIAKNNEDAITIEEKNGKAYLIGIGKSKNMNHDLLKLAEDADLFKLITYACDKECEMLKAILVHLSDAIRWQPKYPVPTCNDSDYKPDGKIHNAVIYGFHLLDVIEPLFKLFENEYASIN